MKTLSRGQPESLWKYPQQAYGKMTAANKDLQEYLMKSRTQAQMVGRSTFINIVPLSRPNIDQILKCILFLLESSQNLENFHNHTYMQEEW